MTKTIPAGAAVSLTANKECSIDFISGDGVAAFDAGEQRELPQTPSLLGTSVVMSWVMPSSKTLKPSVTEVDGFVSGDLTIFSKYLALDNGFINKFGNAAAIGAVLQHWADSDPSNGSFATKAPLRSSEQQALSLRYQEDGHERP